MRVLHLIRRIGALNRGNIITPRQIESACSARLAHTGHNRHSNDMTKPDLALSQIAARFTRHDVEWSRGAFMIIDRRTANPIARLRPIPDTDRFELFYWSNINGRWTTFGLTRSSRATRCSAFRAAKTAKKGKRTRHS
jgi:hypothetical protein